MGYTDEDIREQNLHSKLDEELIQKKLSARTIKKLLRVLIITLTSSLTVVYLDNSSIATILKALEVLNENAGAAILVYLVIVLSIGYGLYYFLKNSGNTEFENGLYEDIIESLLKQQSEFQ